MRIQKFDFEQTEIEGLQIIRPFVAEDERGFFMKTYEKIIFEQHGIVLNNAEDIVSCSKKGVIRGLHFQLENSQDKLVRVLSGKVWDVAVDLRKNSRTYGKWKGVYLSQENKLSLYIPNGFAHGFIALTEDVIFSYRCGELYYPEVDSGIIWNDKNLNIAWPIDEVNEIIVSEKDKKLQSFMEFDKKYRGL